MTKKELRITTAKERKSIADKAEKDRRIAEFLLSSEEYRAARLILCYASLPDEVSTYYIIKQALSDGKEVALPYCTDKAGNMDFYLIKNTTSLNVGTFGVREPDITKCAKAEDFSSSIALVPGLCFDVSGNRLGYGKGYYDRFLKNYASLSFGLCYNRLVKKSIPVNNYDEKVTLLITEEGIINNGGKNG